jgi:hypothetical protein
MGIFCIANIKTFSLGWEEEEKLEEKRVWIECEKIFRFIKIYAKGF